MIKFFVRIILYFACIIIFIPLIITYMVNDIGINDISKKNTSMTSEILSIQQNNNSSNFDDFPDIEMNNFENYIIGVVSAEMPSSFHEEALKAQAIASRTYAYKRVDNLEDEVDYGNIGQAYDTIDNMKDKWGNNFETNYTKIKNAVSATNGIIIVYNDEPIEAVFHSTSAGMTEVAENIWGGNLPYITSVDSSLDENAPDFTYTTTISNDDIISKILAKFPSINKDEILNSFDILNRSSADYVLSVLVGGYVISGQEIRTIFNLRSSNFTIIKNVDNFEFTTKGYGHGVGMSQYGANFMALEGNSYVDILNHYYSDIELKKLF